CPDTHTTGSSTFDALKLCTTGAILIASGRVPKTTITCFFRPCMAQFLKYCLITASVAGLPIGLKPASDAPCKVELTDASQKTAPSNHDQPGSQNALNSAS